MSVAPAVPPADAAATGCPHCFSPLVTEDRQPPWCERCEWNLDVFPPLSGGSWLLRSMTELDRRAGFRADLRLTSASLDAARHGPLTAGHVFLCAVSAVLLLLPLAALVGGVWLVATSGYFPAILLGLLLVGLAYALRPRLGSLRRALRDTYRVGPDLAPTLHALINKVADATDAPRPDVVALDEGWNASAAVVGLRRRRVLILGIPLLVALRGQELVALVGHELGHFRHADSRRSLLTQPARTLFGAISEAVRPPRGDPFDHGLSGIFALAYLVWKVVAGTVSWLLFVVHLGLNVIGAHEHRRAELRADLLAARAAGTTAALGTIDALAMLPLLVPFVQPNGNAWGAMTDWRRDIDAARDHNRERVGRLRQLTTRDASLFASHPAPGRRHQFLAGSPYQAASVVVTESDGRLIDAELEPYVEALRRRLADMYDL